MATLRCTAQIWKRDCYRHAGGRGRHKFAMHYTRQQCSRKAVEGGRCRQHESKIRFTDYRYAEQFTEN